MFRDLKPYQLIVDVAIAGAFFVVAASVEILTTGPSAADDVFGRGAVLLGAVVVAAIFGGALAVRRLSPALALTAAWLGAVVQMGLGRPPGFSDLAIFAVLYVTAAYGSMRVYWAGFASALVGALVITLYLMAGPMLTGGGLSWRTLPFALLLLVAAAFALGLSWTVGALVRTAMRARENRRAQEAAEAEAVVEQERVRIARDMHDVVAHSLAVVIAQADGARYALAAAGSSAGEAGAPGSSDAAVAAAALGTISTTARAALADVRVLLTQLRQPRSPLPASSSAPWGASGGRGPVEGEGPQPTLADLEALYAQVRASGVELRVTVDPAPVSEPPAGAQLAVYRILQEALTNALRHGDGGPVSVRLAWRADRVALEVRNRASRAAPPSHAADAAPGDPRIPTAERGEAAVRPAPGHGIVGMRERAQLAGGRLDAGVGGGEFVVTAELPIGGVS